MNPTIKAYLQQLNFLLGKNPRLEKCLDWRRYIPDPYKAVAIISADFELAWAWRVTKSSAVPLQKALLKASSERKNMPVILKLCEQYNIPITWLTVGHLFLESCKKENGVTHKDMPRLPHFENDWWRFTGENWFEDDPATDYKTDPLWYAPDLIEMIMKSTVNHEIGCHTFSHIDCRDEVCTPEHFIAEIEACQLAAKKFGIDKMVSFVHPGHTIGNLETLADLGFTNFRTDHANIIGYPKKHDNGLWEFSTTLELNCRENWSAASQINSYISTFRRAMRHHAVAYLWFHPSFDAYFVEHIMPPVFEWLDMHRDEIWIVTKGEYVRWLNGKG